MNKRVEKMIPTAIKAVETKLLKNKAIPKQYNGYVSSFGASVIQSGMLIALVYNCRESDRASGTGNSGSEVSKVPLMEAICQVVKKYRQESENSKNLIEYYQSCKDQKLLHDQILDAAVAVKLAIRTFKLEDRHE